MYLYLKSSSKGVLFILNRKSINLSPFLFTYETWRGCFTKFNGLLPCHLCRRLISINLSIIPGSFYFMIKCFLFKMVIRSVSFISYDVFVSISQHFIKPEQSLLTRNLSPSCQSLGRAVVQ